MHDHDALYLSPEANAPASRPRHAELVSRTIQALVLSDANPSCNISHARKKRLTLIHGKISETFLPSCMATPLSGCDFSTAAEMNILSIDERETMTNENFAMFPGLVPKLALRLRAARCFAVLSPICLRPHIVNGVGEWRRPDVRFAFLITDASERSDMGAGIAVARVVADECFCPAGSRFEPMPVDFSSIAAVFSSPAAQR